MFIQLNEATNQVSKSNHGAYSTTVRSFEGWLHHDTCIYIGNNNIKVMLYTQTDIKNYNDIHQSEL